MVVLFETVLVVLEADVEKVGKVTTCVVSRLKVNVAEMVVVRVLSRSALGRASREVARLMDPRAKIESSEKCACRWLAVRLRVCRRPLRSSINNIQTR